MFFFIKQNLFPSEFKKNCTAFCLMAIIFRWLTLWRRHFSLLLYSIGKLISFKRQLAEDTWDSLPNHCKRYDLLHCVNACRHFLKSGLKTTVNYVTYGRINKSTNSLSQYWFSKNGIFLYTKEPNNISFRHLQLNYWPKCFP